MINDKYVVGEDEFDSNLEEDLRVNPANLNDEFATHSEKFAWYATAYELAKDYEMQLKARVERLYAQLDYIVREEGRLAGIKLTEKKVENSVITRDDYVRLYDLYIEAQKNTGLLRAARDAMIHKKDMLISMGANYRAEGASDLSMKMDQYRQLKK